MNVLQPELIHIHRGTILHDIGKIAIPDGILLKEHISRSQALGILLALTAIVLITR